jgi:peroxiredoxin
MPSLNADDQAPDVTLQLHNGESTPLAELYRNRVAVLVFYPKDNTAVAPAGLRLIRVPPSLSSSKRQRDSDSASIESCDWRRGMPNNLLQSRIAQIQ